MKLTDMIISAIIKKGILYEAHNVEIITELPDTNIKVRINIPRMTLRTLKEGEEPWSPPKKPECAS